jgi:hypothetical protein
VDSFRVLHPDSKVYSRYYRRGGREEAEDVGASRIDRNYHWGDLTVSEASYISVAFSDHFAHVVKLEIPENIAFAKSPRSRPFFKTSPEVVRDEIFGRRLKQEMKSWLEVKERGLAILPWWEIVVKPGIRKLAITRSKELKKKKTSELNCLMMKQGYFTRELQAGNMDSMGRLKEVQSDIQQWYQKESEKVVLQSRVDDVQQSEKVRIFHHEQHKKHIKRSSILKLDTREGILEGHDACSEFLQQELANLLLNPAELDSTAQASLLSEVKPVFTDDDN